VPLKILLSTFRDTSLIPLDKDIVADNFSLLAEHNMWRTFGLLNQENNDFEAKRITNKPDNFKKVLLEINLQN
tara:strand:- start:234 stop:452 length:219 start_codon:yes stop_codon:yes gene_type:complete